MVTAVHPNETQAVLVVSTDTKKSGNNFGMWVQVSAHQKCPTPIAMVYLFSYGRGQEKNN